MPNSSTLVSCNIRIDNEMKTYTKEDLEKREKSFESSAREGKLLC